MTETCKKCDAAEARYAEILERALDRRDAEIADAKQKAEMKFRTKMSKAENEVRKAREEHDSGRHE